MKKEPKNTYGQILILNQQEIFDFLTNAISTTAQGHENATVALTGGSTPKVYYKFIKENPQLIDKKAWDSITWMTSDERYVPLESEDSNFGCATRGMLDALQITQQNRLTWNTSLDPKECANQFNKQWNQKFSSNKGFDLCFLGMGDDCHTASLFPQSELLKNPIETNFSEIEVPGKGWRLTTTINGLSKCGQIIINATGANKAKALNQIINGEYDPINKPSQILKQFSDKVTWLVDQEAASDL